MTSLSASVILGVCIILIIINYCTAQMLFDYGAEVNGYDEEDDQDDCKCTVNVVEIEKTVTNPPLYLNSETGNIIYPMYHHPHFIVPTTGIIELHCPGGEGIYIGPSESEMVLVPEENVTAICLSDWKFQTGDIVTDLRLARCQKPIQVSAYLTHMKCGSVYTSQNREIKIGFKLKNGQFLQRYLVCFNFIRRTPVYSRSLVTNTYIRNDPIEVPKIHLAKDFVRILYNISIYKTIYLRYIINEQLSAPMDDTNVIDETQNRTLLPGFLVPPLDFFYKSEKQLAHYYVNTVPLWKNFQTGDWKWVHDLIRSYAYHNNASLLVYTGTYGKTKLFSRKEGIYEPIYLLTKGERSAFPIPILIWKIIYDDTINAGIALVGLNNGFKSKNRYAICPDISPTLTWFQRDNRIPEDVYACTVDDLRVNIPHIPSLIVEELLHLKQNINETVRSVNTDQETKE